MTGVCLPFTCFVVDKLSLSFSSFAFNFLNVSSDDFPFVLPFLFLLNTSAPRVSIFWLQNFIQDEHIDLIVQLTTVTALHTYVNNKIIITATIATINHLILYTLVLDSVLNSSL